MIRRPRLAFPEPAVRCPSCCGRPIELRLIQSLDECTRQRIRNCHPDTRRRPTDATHRHDLGRLPESAGKAALQHPADPPDEAATPAQRFQTRSSKLGDRFQDRERNILFFRTSSAPARIGHGKSSRFGYLDTVLTVCCWATNVRLSTPNDQSPFFLRCQTWTNLTSMVLRGLVQ